MTEQRKFGGVDLFDRVAVGVRQWFNGMVVGVVDGMKTE
jgi:hypothetical protein